VEAWKAGDRVADLTVIGGNTSHLVRKAAGLVRVPEDVDAAEAVSLVLSGVTASQMLFRHARVARGARILIQGGNGAVGWFANQLAVQAGVDVWTTARPEHHERLRAIGTHPLDYRDPDYPAAIVEQTGGGVDVVFDGQGADRFRPSLASLKRGGRLVMIGASQAVNRGGSMIVAGAVVLARNLNPFGPRVSLYSITTTRKRHAAWFGEDLAQLFGMLQRRELDVRVERRIDYDQVAQAHADLERGGMSGKVVLVTP
ncbi:MAG TPA: zinc-binding dehydrogenase, partial [Polyangiaceae bacterium LLY-WYZ-14_1]|nr:zinc-binding dehydrogenase [Polyangiaceae bacterium LLY-WYZ-14_1]